MRNAHSRKLEAAGLNPPEACQHPDPCEIIAEGGNGPADMVHPTEGGDIQVIAWCPKCGAIQTWVYDQGEVRDWILPRSRGAS